METTLYFKQIYYDRQQLNQVGKTHFFTESEDYEESVSSLTEGQAVAWLFRTPTLQRFFIEEFFEYSSSIKVYSEIEEPITEKNKIPGDIDLLLIDTQRPHQSIAFECKRVKAVYQSEGKSKVNNSNKIRKGVIQANKYRELGFHKTYLVIILLDDARASKLPNVMMRSSDASEVKHIYSMEWYEKLHPDVGLVFIKVSQPTGKGVNQFGGIGICIDKRSNPIDQTNKLNTDIKFILRNYQTLNK